MRGVTLEEISAATRISTRFLEALESDQWDQLPGGVFNRGFIRSIARFLGLDEDSLVAEYALETKHRTDSGVVPDPPIEVPRQWGAILLAATLLVVILAGSAFLAYRYGPRLVALMRHSHATPSATAEASPPPAPSSASAPSPSSASAQNDSGAAPGLPVPVPNYPSPSSSSAPLASPSAALALKVEAGKPADLKVLADGRSVYDAHVEAGTVLHFDAQDTLTITSSDSSAILLELNGQTVAPIGVPGQPGTVTLTHNDLKPAAGASH